MKLDSTQRSWFFLSIAIFVVCLAIYVPYALTAARGPTGGSAVGPAFGIVGVGFMLFWAGRGARGRGAAAGVGPAPRGVGGALWVGMLGPPANLVSCGID